MDHTFDVVFINALIAKLTSPGFSPTRLQAKIKTD